MIMPSIAGAVTVVNGLTAQVVSSATTINGTGIDISNYEGTLLAVLNSAAASASDTLTVTIEESYDNSNWAAIPADAMFDVTTGDDDTFDQVTDAAASFQVRGLRKERLARYIRFVAVSAGGTISFPFSASLVAPLKDV